MYLTSRLQARDVEGSLSETYGGNLYRAFGCTEREEGGNGSERTRRRGMSSEGVKEWGGKWK